MSIQGLTTLGLKTQIALSALRTDLQPSELANYKLSEEELAAVRGWLEQYSADLEALASAAADFVISTNHTGVNVAIAGFMDDTAVLCPRARSFLWLIPKLTVFILEKISGDHDLELVRNMRALAQI